MSIISDGIKDNCTVMAKVVIDSDLSQTTLEVKEQLFTGFWRLAPVKDCQQEIVNLC